MKKKAKIYIPAKTATQSGRGKQKTWVLEFETKDPHTNSLMGWESSSDTLKEVKLKFTSKDKAIEYLQLYTNWKDTLYNQENANAIAEMQTKYETEKKDSENRLLLTEQKLDKAEISSKSSMQLMLVLGLLISLLVVAYVFYSLNEKKKTNSSPKTTIIQQQNMLTNSFNLPLRNQITGITESNYGKCKEDGNKFQGMVSYLFIGNNFLNKDDVRSMRCVNSEFRSNIPF